MSDAVLRAKARFLERPFIAALASQPLLRRAFALSAALGDLPPRGVALTRTEFGGIAGLEARPTGVTSPPRLLYLHGGGFTIGSARTHRGLVARLAAAAVSAAFAPDYRLAPEHPFPAAHDDAEAVYDAMAARARIAVAGDSAGGNLAAALCLSRDPVAAALLSPVLDFTRIGAEPGPDFSGELLIPPVWADRILAAIAAPDLADPRLTSLPHLDGSVPTLVHVGAGEVLRHDAEALAAKGAARIEVFEGVPHVWQLHGSWAASARASLTGLGTFLAKHLT
ncbi:MAG: alpha/beta hydrolase fold domain-containing protein [Shimia sp.]